MASKELIRKENLNDYKEMMLFGYSTKHLLKKDKIRFYYALKGRDGKSGIIKSLKAQHLARGIVLIGINQSKEFKSFLDYWKCEYVGKRLFVK